MARLNAQHLLSAARLLYQANYFAQGAVLAILAIEEVQKIPILLDLLLADSEGEVKRLWSNYRKHGPKQKRFSKWLGLKAWVDKHERFTPQEVENRLSDPTLDENVIELKKQLYLYTDVFSGIQWTLPARMISKTEATKIVLSARSATLKYTRLPSSRFGGSSWLDSMERAITRSGSRYWHLRKNFLRRARPRQTGSESLGAVSKHIIEPVSEVPSTIIRHLLHY